VLRHALAILIILVTGLSAADIAAAEDSPLSIQPVGPDSIESHTRQPVTFALAVTNSGAAGRTLALDPELPEGWKALTQESELAIGPSATDVHIVSLLVPSRTPAAEYALRYRVRDLDDPSVSAECSLKVVVLPEIALEVKLLESPVFVIAGSMYVVSFVITNSGNADARADIEVVSGSSFPFEIRGLEPGAVAAVAAGGATEFSIAVRTETHLRESMRHPLQVTVRLLRDETGANAASAESREARAASTVEVVPLTVNDSVLAHTIQLDSETTATAGYDQVFSAGVQQEIKGRGTLDEAGEHRVELDLTKQLGLSFDPLVNPLDRYSFQYESRFGSLSLGDLPYTVSPLLAQDAFGRGAQGTLNLFPVRLGALYYEDAWSSPGKQAAGGSADFTIPRKGDWNDLLYRVGASALSRLDGNTVFDVFQQYDPAKNLSFQADAALQAGAAGTLSPAVLALSEGDLDAVSWTARYLRAWPDFEGTYSDTQSFLGIADLHLLGGSLTLHGGFSLADSNLLLRTTLPNADRTMELSLGAGGELPGWKTKLRLDWEGWGREDRLPAASYRTWDNILRIVANQPFTSFRLGLNSMLDFEHNDLDLSSSIQQEHVLAFAYTPTETAELGISLRFNGRLDSGGHAQDLVGADLNARAAIGLTRLEGQVNTSFIYTETGFSEAQLGINARLTHPFPWGHTLSIRPDVWLDYTGGAWVPTWSLALTYGVPFDVPISRRPDTAVVTGFVSNAVTGERVPGVVLRLDGLAAVTDKKGAYTFYVPHAGTKYIQVDMRTVGAGLVPVRSMPMELQAPRGSKVSVDIALTQGCTVSGNVGEYGFPDQSSAFVPSDQGGAAGEAAAPVRTRLRGLANLIVELTDGSEPHRKLTSPTGDFSFEEIRPGKYTLRIVEGNLPDYSTVDPAVFDLDLAPGESRAVEFRVLQEQRRIKILQSGETPNVGESSGVAEGATIILEGGSSTPPVTPR
jgi:hypothetical protein